MERESRNFYKFAREITESTQEAWAETIGVSVESVRNYEAGRQIPSDDVVKAMIEVSGVTPLKTWHARNKSELVADIMPNVEWVPLSQAICSVSAEFLNIAEKKRIMRLVEMAADGRIDEFELDEFQTILDEFKRLSKAVFQLEYSKKGGGEK